MPDSTKKRTMYVHTLDKRPARLLRFHGGRASMVAVTPTVRLKPLASLSAIRWEWNAHLDSFVLEYERANPQASGEQRSNAVHLEIKRLGYFLVEVPA